MPETIKAIIIDLKAKKETKAESRNFFENNETINTIDRICIPIEKIADVVFKKYTKFIQCYLRGQLVICDNSVGVNVCALLEPSEKTHVGYPSIFLSLHTDN